MEADGGRYTMSARSGEMTIVTGIISTSSQQESFHILPKSTTAGS